MNKWFKHFPYAGWITIFIVALLSCIGLYQFEKNQYSPQRLAIAVQKDFSAKEQAVDNDIRKNTFAHLLQPDFDDSLISDYFLYLCEQGNTLYWNTTLVDLPPEVKNYPDSFVIPRLSKIAGGTFFIRSVRIDKEEHSLNSKPRYAFAIIPLVFRYPIENQYFQSRFVADARIPLSTEITDKQGEGIVIRNLEGKPAFILCFREPTEQFYVAGPWVWLLAVIAMFSAAFWIHEFCYNLGIRWKKPILGWLVLQLFLFLFDDIFIYRIGFPLGFQNAMLFSPKLFSSGEEVVSLGNLIVDVLLNAWILIYLLAYVPLSKKKIVRNRILNIGLKLSFVFLLIFLLYHSHADIMYMLVIDSKISFEVGDISGLTVYTFIGIFTLSVITINFLAILGIINALLKKSIAPYFLKYVVVVAISVIYIYFHSGEGINYFYLFVLITSVTALLLIDSLGLPLQSRRRQYSLSIAPTTYIWFAILCSWITLEVFYFNYSKEKDLRKIFAQKQAQKDDGFVAYTFNEFAADFRQDSIVRHFFEKPSPELVPQLNKYIFYNHIASYASKYHIDIYYYDRTRTPMYSKDSLDKPLLRLADSLNGAKQQYGLVNVENYLPGNKLYWFLTPVPSYAQKDTLGYLGFCIAIENSPRAMKLRSFLGKKHNPTDQQYFDNYSYGIYRKGALWTQAGDNIFPFKNRYPHVAKEFTFKEALFHSSLIYRASKDELVQVVYKRNLLTDLISLFSYVLAVLLVITGAVFLSRQFLFYPGKLKHFFSNFNFTIRSKVNLTILVTVFASLFVVGLITISFLNNKYKESQGKDLRSMTLYYAQNILHYTEEHKLDFRDTTKEPLSVYSELSFRLVELAEEQGGDINLYDARGKLMATSQLELLKKGLISRYLRHDILLSLQSGEVSELTEKENIGELAYQSVYTPLRDEKDNIFAYINLPYYASHKELNDEISNVLLSLINVYTLIFFLSGICAILISNNIIRSFKLLIEQFRNIRLSRNEFIKWPYKDEIGVLVKEYNAMMQKVEAMAARQARIEREEAWREIARQVAHEIKNPLTPMKLNIQYLQQAIQNGRPDIEALASRVSVTLIEQIENLNLIASEFSSFARMPDARPELLDLYTSLLSIVVLFQKDEKVTVSLEPGQKNVTVNMDKGYFMRIFNNLIQNAIQAGTEGEGKVIIRYEQKDQYVVVSVADNGCGISDEMKEKLFVPYFTTKSSGTGLGLPMTKNMVESSNGQIWFETIINEQTIFYVKLPVSGAGEQ